MKVVPDHTVIDVDGLSLDVNEIVTDAFKVFAELDSRFAPRTKYVVYALHRIASLEEGVS